MNYKDFSKLVYCVILVHRNKDNYDSWFLYHSENYEDVEKFSINLLKKTSFFDMVDIQVRSVHKDGTSYLLDDITFTKEDVLNE